MGAKKWYLWSWTLIANFRVCARQKVVVMGKEKEKICEINAL